MKVDLIELDHVLSWLREIEHADLSKIEWFHRGCEIIPDRNLVEEWKFVGLNNRTFAEMNLIEYMPILKTKEDTDA
jgi:hypothetical protein